MMSQIMRCVVVLNDNRLLEIILSDSTIYHGILGGIEYDPELQRRGTWRHFLNNQATFQEVIPMDNHVELKNSIHVAYRGALLRDAATRPGMDDGALSGLVQFLYFTHAEIISSLVKDKKYLRQIVMLCVGSVENDDASGEKVAAQSKSRGYALRFLQEMCSIAKGNNIPMSTRDELFACLLQDLPLFDALTNSLSDFTLQTRELTAAAEVLAALVSFDQGSALRLHILKKGAHPSNPSWTQQAGNENGSSCASPSAVTVNNQDSLTNLQNSPPIPCKQSLLSVVLHLLAYHDDLGCILHYNEVISKCIEVEMMEASERDAFLSVFYDHYIHWLVDPLVRDDIRAKVTTKTGTTTPTAAAAAASTEPTSEASNPPPTTSSPSSESSYSNMRLTSSEKQSRAIIADMLSYCLKAHTYRMRYFVLRNGMIGRVTDLCRHPDKFLKLAGLRFIRACVGAKDDFLNRHIVKKDCFAIVFEVFVQNKARDNLISSAVIDIVEFIRTENMSRLVKKERKRRIS
jgi:protein phosphatase 4 regulatory subunit 3